ncbi:MAG TPA: isoamylase early set domain-containing protein [Ilumatobacteraceae bacterium]
MSSDTPIDVTLRLPAGASAGTVFVAGEFNDWSLDHDQMERDDDGGFCITLHLEPGKAYRYRYWVDDARWENDWAADAYEENPFGGHDSVVDLTVGSPRIVTPPPASAATPPQQPSAPAGTPDRSASPAPPRGGGSAR